MMTVLARAVAVNMTTLPVLKHTHIYKMNCVLVL